MVSVLSSVEVAYCLSSRIPTWLFSSESKSNLRFHNSTNPGLAGRESLKQAWVTICPQGQGSTAGTQDSSSWRAVTHQARGGFPSTKLDSQG